MYYSYRVRAGSPTGDSNYSNIASNGTLGLPPAPSNLTAVGVSSARVDLSWTDNAPNEADFKIERCQGNGCTNFAQIATVAANVTTFADTGLAA